MESLEEKLINEDPVYCYANNITSDDKDLCINFDSTRKNHLFTLGLAFASEKRVSKINLEELKVDGPKSFDKMLYIWWKNGLKPFFTNFNHEDHAFLICPVRMADEQTKEKLFETVSNMEKDGMKIHYPARDTNQNDSYGYRICLDNANAISDAKNVFIYYNRNSVGSLFDLGVAYYFQMKYPDRTIKVLNEDQIQLDPNDFGDKIILSMLNMQKMYREQNNTRKRS